MVKRGLVGTRSEATRLIDERVVSISGAIAEKASRLVSPDEPIEILKVRKYVSRGGEKMEGALDAFGIAVSSRSVIDVGSSTGGFTDCVLQRGAARVFAVDVGRNQLHERIAADERVKWREGVNVRDLGPADLPFTCSLLVADLSFISLTVVMGALDRLVSPEDGFPDAERILLVKPQFEAGHQEASKGRGVITDTSLHMESVEKVVASALDLGWHQHGLVESPIKGQDGNTEFLLHLARVRRA